VLIAEVQLYRGWAGTHDQRQQVASWHHVVTAEMPDTRLWRTSSYKSTILQVLKFFTNDNMLNWYFLRARMHLILIWSDNRYRYRYRIQSEFRLNIQILCKI
jgi:acetyltransferase-like isoleucine patch superfamily enzyme